MNAIDLENKAMEARRIADIAKHVPLSMEVLDKYGEDVSRAACQGHIPLIRATEELANDYARALRPLFDAIKLLRAEALYWRYKYLEAEKIVNTSLLTKGKPTP